MTAKLRSLIGQLDDLIARMHRQLSASRRIRDEMRDNPNLHLAPCTVCKSMLTRYGVCATCEAKSNGHSRPHEHC